MTAKKLSWDDADQIYDSEEDYNQLCEKSQAYDFYFHINSGSYGLDGCDISICPKVFFDKYNYCWDVDLMIEHLLPDDFEEMMPGNYLSDRSIQDLKNDLLKRGFVQNNKFDNFMDDHYDDLDEEEKLVLDQEDL